MYKDGSVVEGVWEKGQLKEVLKKTEGSQNLELKKYIEIQEDDLVSVKPQFVF